MAKDVEEICPPPEEETNCEQASQQRSPQRYLNPRSKSAARARSN